MESHTSRLHMLIMAALALPMAALLLAPGAARAAPPIVIGATISETGPLAVDAGFQIRGMETAVEEANKAGGWLGRKVELKYYDDKSNTGTAVRLYERLITDDRVNLLIGPYSSLIGVAVAPLINKYKMVAVEPGSSVPSIYVKGNEWNIQGTPSSIQYLEGLLGEAQKAGAKTVALLGLQSAFTLACYHARVAEAGKLGMKIVYQQTYALPQPDFSSMALAVKNARPDVVEACTYYPDSVSIARALHQQGFAPKYFGETVGPVEPQFIKALGPIANLVISNTSWAPNFKTAGNDTFVAAYKAKFNQEPDYHAASGYSAIETLGAAVKGTGSLDQAKLRDWLLHNSVETVQGTFKVDPNGLSIGYAQYLTQIQNGELKVVTPEKWAQAKLEAPYTGM